jgi:DnaK suppressor protein
MSITDTRQEQSQINGRKEVLQAKLKELTGASPEREELHIEYSADPLDQVKSTADREVAIHRIDQHAAQIREIRAALAQIDDGTYGICEQCDEPISQKRLTAVPWARLCVACQSREEAESRRSMELAQVA